MSLVNEIVSVKKITYNVVLNDESLIENVETQETTHGVTNFFKEKKTRKPWVTGRNWQENGSS